MDWSCRCRWGENFDRTFFSAYSRNRKLYKCYICIINKAVIPTVCVGSTAFLFVIFSSLVISKQHFYN